MIPLLAAPTIYSLLLKYLLPLLAIILLLVGIYSMGVKNGKDIIKKEWEIEKGKQAIVTSRILEDNIRTIQALRIANREELTKRKLDYERAIRGIMSTKSTGLQLPKGSCPASPATMPRDSSASNGASDSPLRGRLPDKIEQDLRAVMNEANVCTVRLLKLQDFVSTTLHKGN